MPYNPVPLVLKRQKPRLNPLRLQHPVRREPLGDGTPVVALPVDNERGWGVAPVSEQFRARGIPLSELGGGLG